MGFFRYYKTSSLQRSSVVGLINAKNSFGDVDAGNYAEFESDGTMLFHGDATVWDDLRVAATATRSAANSPSFTAWKDGLLMTWFDKAGEEMIYFDVQLPHSWKEGTSVEAHVHWVPKTSQTSQNVCWALEYSWAKIGGIFATSDVIYGNTITVPSGITSPVANTHYLTSLGMLDPASWSVEGVSSMLSCRLYRDATSSLATDDYNDDAGLLEMYFHIEKDTVGSRLLYQK